jgi:hypothetical protein
MGRHRTEAPSSTQRGQWQRPFGFASSPIAASPPQRRIKLAPGTQLPKLRKHEPPPARRLRDWGVRWVQQSRHEPIIIRLSQMIIWQVLQFGQFWQSDLRVKARSPACAGDRLGLLRANTTRCDPLVRGDWAQSRPRGAGSLPCTRGLMPCRFYALSGGFSPCRRRWAWVRALATAARAESLSVNISSASSSASTTDVIARSE